MKTSELNNNYIHGSACDFEEKRLCDQAKAAEKFLWSGLVLNKIISHDLDKPFLELGCGAGAQTNYLLMHLPENIKVIAIDVDENQIARAEKFASNNKINAEKCQFLVCDITNKNFEDKAYSGAYISWVLEHIGNSKSQSLLSKLYTAVQDGGAIIINEIIMEPGVGVIIQGQNGSS